MIPALRPNTEIREKILTLEERINAYNAENGLAIPACPVLHHFAPGAYCRQIFIPKNNLIVGKIHKHAHLNMIMQGRVSVATEEGVKHYQAPMVLVSQAGTKRVVYTHEDTIWATVHLTDKTDLVEIEDEIIAKTYDDYDEGLLAYQLMEALCPG